MLEKFRKVDNPLTIIAIFAGITEVAASAALPFLHQDTQLVFVWFLILFPFALIVAFFVTLNFNTRVLYAPSDYRDDKTFLEALRLSGDTVQLSVTSPDDIPPSIQEVKRIADQQPGMSPFDGITRAELDSVNSAFKHFQGNVKVCLNPNSSLATPSVSMAKDSSSSQQCFTQFVVRVRNLESFVPAHCLMEQWS